MDYISNDPTSLPKVPPIQRIIFNITYDYVNYLASNNIQHYYCLCRLLETSKLLRYLLMFLMGTKKLGKQPGEVCNPEGQGSPKITAVVEKIE